MYYYGPMSNGNDWAWGVVMTGLWLLILILVGAFAMKALHGHDSQAAHRNQPLEIAKTRYARGEIKKEEFEQLKKDLGK